MGDLVLHLHAAVREVLPGVVAEETLKHRAVALHDDTVAEDPLVEKSLNDHDLFSAEPHGLDVLPEGLAAREAVDVQESFNFAVRTPENYRGFELGRQALAVNKEVRDGFTLFEERRSLKLSVLLGDEVDFEYFQG